MSVPAIPEYDLEPPQLPPTSPREEVSDVNATQGSFTSGVITPVHATRPLVRAMARMFGAMRPVHAMNRALGGSSGVIVLRVAVRATLLWLATGFMESMIESAAYFTPSYLHATRVFASSEAHPWSRRMQQPGVHVLRLCAGVRPLCVYVC